MNSNPETVSTDYDTSSRLYFEPLTIEDVLNVIEKERPEGIIIQFGGQTPLKLANGIQAFLEKNQLPASSGKSFYDATLRLYAAGELNISLLLASYLLNHLVRFICVMTQLWHLPSTYMLHSLVTTSSQFCFQ